MTASGEALHAAQVAEPPQPPIPGPPATPAFEAVLLAVLAVPLAVAIAALAWRSTLKIPINYNEGCNAYFVAAVLAHTPLYFPPDALLTNNYPPLSFYLLAPLAGLIGDALFAGRLVAWIAFAAIAALIAAIVYRLNGDRLAALFGGTIFAAYMVTNYDIYVGMNDPQMLAHAIMLLGLWVYLRGASAAWSAVAAALLMGCGLFVKHNVVALPLAFAVWLAIYDRRAAVRFVAAGILTAAAGLACCLGAFGPDFFTSLLAPRQYLPVRAWRHAIEWLQPMQLPVVLAVLGAVLGRENRSTVLFALYLLAALLLACLLAGGASVNFNIMFEVVIAFSLAGGQLIARLRRQKLLCRWAVGGYAFAALLNAGLVGTKDQLLLGPWIATERAREAATLATVRALAERPGPALCETPAVCYWAGKPFELDPFNFEQGVIAGSKDERVVLRRIAAGFYSAVELTAGNPDQAEPGFLGPRLPAAVAARYRELSLQPGAFRIYVNPAAAPLGSDPG